MSKIIQKLSSRKLWATILGVIVGIAVTFGVDEGAISIVAGSVTSIGSIVTYIITEGRIDAAAVKKAVDQIAATQEEQE